MIDFTTLLFGSAISTVVLALLIFGACLLVRQTGYLLTMGFGILGVGMSCTTLGLYRLGGVHWLGMATIVSLMTSFLLIHWAISQYMGRTKLGLFEISTVPAITLSGIVFGFGYDGAAFVLCFVVTAFLVSNTALVYWRHRREVPYLMDGLAFMGAATAAVFALRAFAIASAGQWVIGAAPFNWAEDLTAVMALGMVTAFGPMVVGLYHFQDRIKLISVATTDPLTGLANRRALNEQFGQALFTSKMAVIMFDLDHFKKANDVFGHQIGDEVLKRFAYVVARHTNNDTKGYRLGGEEFAVVTTRGGLLRADEIAKSINVSFGAEVVRTQLGPLRGTVSGGVASGSPAAQRLDEVLALADAALYEAKRAGRNRVVLHGQMSGERIPDALRVA